MRHVPKLRRKPRRLRCVKPKEACGPRGVAKCRQSTHGIRRGEFKVRLKPEDTIVRAHDRACCRAHRACGRRRRVSVGRRQKIQLNGCAVCQRVPRRLEQNLYRTICRSLICTKRNHVNLIRRIRRAIYSHSRRVCSVVRCRNDGRRLCNSIKHQRRAR